jgi:hypothetical protein
MFEYANCGSYVTQQRNMKRYPNISFVRCSTFADYGDDVTGTRVFGK